MIGWQDIQDRMGSIGNRNQSSKGKTAAAVAIGSAAGLVIGILFAPKSGKETRQALIQISKDSVGHSKQKAKETKDAVEDRVSQAAEIAKGAKQGAKDAAKQNRSSRTSR